MRKVECLEGGWGIGRSTGFGFSPKTIPWCYYPGCHPLMLLLLLYKYKGCFFGHILCLGY